MTATTATTPDVRESVSPASKNRHPFRPVRLLLYVFLTVVALVWLGPLLLAVYASLRPYSETASLGYVSLPHHLSLQYYVEAWNEGNLPKYFTNTMIITIPSLLIILFLASFVGFAIVKLRIPFGIPLLILFTAGNLLPQQSIVIPLYEVFKRIPLPEFMSDSLTIYDSYWAVMLVHIGFQTGFCVFVLANYMRTIPYEITEAAIMDGAGSGSSTGR